MKNVIGLLILLAATHLCQTVAAQNYPARPLRIVVGSPAGGPVDIVGRIVAAKLTEVMGQPVIIDNRVGANAIIGTDFVAKSAPDGYTMILATSGSLAISPAIYPKMPYDTLRDLAPVTQVTTTPEVLVTHPSVPVKSINDLVALARAKPGELNFASGGNGSVPHMALELLKSVAKINIVHIAYSGGGPAAAAVVGGQVHGMFAGLPVLLPHIKNGKLRALGLAAPQRSPLMPEVATLGEGGYPSIIVVDWYGILVPSKTPPEIIARLHDDIAKTVGDPVTRDKLRSAGATATTSTSTQFGEQLRADLARWSKLAQTVSIKVD